MYARDSAREAVMAAFAKKAPQAPAAPDPPEPEDDEFDEAAWLEILAGVLASNLAWSTERFGPPLGSRGCRVPAHLLKANAF